MCPCLSSPGLHRLHRQRRRLGEAHDRAWRGCRGRQGSGLGFARHVGLCVVATGLILSRPPSPFRAVAAPLPASSLFCVAVCSSVGCTCPLWLWDPARRPHIPTDVSTCELARFRCWRSDQKRNPFDYVEGCILDFDIILGTISAIFFKPHIASNTPCAVLFLASMFRTLKV